MSAACHHYQEKRANAMIWLLSIPILVFVGWKMIWLSTLDGVIKKHRRMRMEISPGDISQFGPFDDRELQRLTRELHDLGFVTLGDLLSRMDFDPVTPLAPAPIPDPDTPRATTESLVETQTEGVGRIFAHPEHGCYASLISVVSVSRFAAQLNREDMVNLAPFRTVILSMGENPEEKWSFATHNREVDPFSLLQRHPRALTRRMVEADAQQLFQSHLTEREEIAKSGGFRWEKSPSLAKYRAFEARVVPHIRDVYRRANTLGVAWHLMTYRFKKHDSWRGELAAR